MKTWFEQFIFTPRMMCFADGDAPAGGAAVVDPTPTPDPAAAAPAPDPAPTPDPADPLASFASDLEKLGVEEPTAEPVADPTAATVPQEFLQISPFVTDTTTMQQAVRAADEVWKVASGEANAAGLIEGIREANPQRFQGILNELIPYIEQVTGKKFGDGQAPDPVQQLRSEIAQRDQQREQAAQQAQYQASVQRAVPVAMDAVTEALKGTFAEGEEKFFLQQCAAKAKIPEAQMIQALLSGNKQPLMEALKAVKADETRRFKVYSQNFIKQRSALAKSVPATKNTPASSTVTPASAKRLPGETITQMATRLWQEGKTQ